MKHAVVFRTGIASSSFSFVMVCAALFAGAFGCAKVTTKGQTGSGGSHGSGSGGSVGSGSGGSTVVMPVSCNGPCTDFPADPQIVDGAPPNAASMFGGGSGAGPCITEPEDQTLFPNNWLRPRVRAAGATPPLKITLHADKEANDLVVYTGKDTWAMPKDIWNNLARHVVLEDITVTVQAAGSGPANVKFQVAPTGAAGSMVFWAADPSQVDKMGVETMPVTAIVNDAELRGFAVGDESTISALRIDQVKQPTFQQDGHNTRQAHCIGCHSGTPDGDFVAFVDAWPWPAAFANVKEGTVGDPLAGYTGATCATAGCTGNRTFVQLPWAGPLTFSPMHWSAGDRIAIAATQLQDPAMPWSTDNKQPGKLAWIDTESTATTMVNGIDVPMLGAAYGYIARTGDTRGAAFPTWSHDGETIVYASTMGANMDGRLEVGATDLYSVPYGNKAGGAAKPVPGASDPGVEEYYPAYSPDDRLLIFNTVPSGQKMYANPSAELSVVRLGGGKAERLLANSPPACSGKKSPGVNNHWAKWSPEVHSVDGKTYYWAIFSSNRYGLPTVMSKYRTTGIPVEVSQLYITAIVADETGISTHGAIYLWNQPQTTINTTPAWEKFEIPVVK